MARALRYSDDSDALHDDGQIIILEILLDVSSVGPLPRLESKDIQTSYK